MHFLRLLLLATFCGTICSGCGQTKIAELTAELQALKAQVEKLTAQNAELAAELEASRAQLASMEEIRTGYETARVEFQKNLAQLAPLLGVTESPLPPFEALKDSSWVGRFAPSPEMKSGLNELEQQLRGLLEPPGTAGETAPGDPN